MAAKQTVFFDALSVPCKGMNSALAPSRLQPGEFSLLENVRLSDGSIKVRGGCGFFGSVVAASDFRGSWAGIFNQVNSLFCVTAHANVARVWTSTDGFTWVEITAAAGPAGNSRMTDPGGLFTLEKVWNPIQVASTTFDGDCLIIQNGVDKPRVYGYSPAAGISGYVTGIVSAIAPNTANRDVSVRLSLGTQWNTYTSGLIAYTNSTVGHFSGADAGGTLINSMVLSIKSGAVSGDNVITAQANGPAGELLYFGNQILIGVDSAYPFFWDVMKLEVFDNSAGAFIVLFDPSAAPYSQSSYTITPMSATSTMQIYAFSIQSNPALYHAAGRVWKLRWTFVGVAGSAPTATQTANVFLVQGGDDGAVNRQNPGGTQFAITYYNSMSKTESPGVIYTKYTPDKIYTPQGHLPVPPTPFINFTYHFPITVPTTADLAGGADWVIVYRQKSSEVQLLMSDIQPIQVCGPPVWTTLITNGNHIGTGANYDLYGGGTAGADSTFQIYMPDSFHIPVPIATAMKSCNQRFFVGGSPTGTANLLFSQYQHAFRFRVATRTIQGPNGIYVTDETSPSSQNIRGEQVNAIFPVASSVVGVPTLYIFTNKGLYAAQGLATSQLSTQTFIAPHGTISPASIALLKNTLFWVDQDMQIRRMQYGFIKDPARRIVDNLTKGVPGTRKGFLSGVVHNDRYYLAFTPHGQTTNTQILVWEDFVGTWTLDVPPHSAEGLIPWFSANANRTILILFSGEVNVYQHDVDGSDGETALLTDLAVGAANIPVSITTAEIHADGYAHGIVVRRVQIICDDLPAGSFTVTRTYKPTGVQGISTMSIDSGENQSWAFDGEVADAGTVMNGASCLLNIAGNLMGNAQILGIAAEVEPTSGNAGTNSA